MSLGPTPWASSPATRVVMQANRSSGTQPELAVRRAVLTMGLRYFANRGPIRDVHLAVFVDSCIWNGCPEHYAAPKSNIDYWANRVERNRGRDAQTDERLTSEGWEVLRIWEHVEAVEAAVLAETAGRRLMALPAVSPQVAPANVTRSTSRGSPGCAALPPSLGPIRHGRRRGGGRRHCGRPRRPRGPSQRRRRASRRQPCGAGRMGG